MPSSLLRHSAAAWSLLGVAMLFVSSCTIWTPNVQGEAPDGIFGFAPVYISEAEAFDIGSELPRAFVNATTPAVSGSLLFVVDRGLGVHVIENSDPANPRSLNFLRIPGVTTVTISGNRLFADSVGDLVTIDISDLDNIVVLNRTPGLFPQPQSFPEGERGWFTCVDASLGFVVRWEEAFIDDPQCRLE